MSYKEVVSERSYLNIMLLNAAIPGSKSEEDKTKRLHANDYFSRFM